MSATTLPQTNFERTVSADIPPSTAAGALLTLERRAESRPAQPLFMARRRHDLLTRTVAEEIVPRLVLTQRDGVAQCIAATSMASDVEELASLVLQTQFNIASPHIERISNRQAGTDAIYLDLLAPVARHLGLMWEDDLCDFVQVTIGLLRLQQILTTTSTPLEQAGTKMQRSPRVLLVPGPGDQHSFGMSMVASFFQRAGWTGWSGVPGTPADLLNRVRTECFAVIGFSVSNDQRLDALTSAIRAVRRASRNREVGIMVGGPVFIAHPELVTMVGADTTAADGRQAVLQAQRLLTLIPSRG